MERRHLDGDHVVDAGKAAPEFGIQHHAAHGRLQVEADQRDFGGHRFAMRDDGIHAGILHGGEAEQPGVIAQLHRGLRFLHRLRGLACQSADHDEWTVGPGFRVFHRGGEHGFVQADLADGELRGMHADRQTARTGIDIIAAERALALAVELAVSIQRQRMRGDRHALAQIGQNISRQFGMMQTHDPVPCSL